MLKRIEIIFSVKSMVEERFVIQVEPIEVSILFISFLRFNHLRIIFFKKIFCLPRAAVVVC